MATAELSKGGRRRRLPVGARAAWLRAYAAIWVATLGSAALVALLGAPITRTVRHLLGLRLEPDRNPPPQVGHVLALAAHNIAIAAWPLLLGVAGAHQHRLARHVADGVLLACIAVNTVLVGGALGAYGTSLLPYIPQLPLEWAALALGASSWLTHRRTALTFAEWLAAIACLLVCAAVLETGAVPHR